MLISQVSSGHDLSEQDESGFIRIASLRLCVFALISSPLLNDG
jgi:hypothetical protein